ncbi:MAG: polyprenyl synthetase family protein [Deltaproteobacteria bacterium]|nr:polyprenyl synthetase family protein [Deltaproteobacteria bacterium]
MLQTNSSPQALSARDVFDDLRQRVDVRLHDVLTQAHSHAQERARDAAAMVASVLDLTMRGGKRMRPAMVLAAVECIGESASLSAAITDVSAGIELLQTYLLIHDDWMDGDRVRRGGPTVHVMLSEQYGGEAIGASVAILAGDFASAVAQDLASSALIPRERLFDVYRTFVWMQREVVLGQTLDVLNSGDLDAIHDMKTGSYTVRGPLALGHALAGGTAAQWTQLERFAQPLGIAFQLRDDLIGSFGDERETGKSAASDLRQGKMSAPVRWALERLEPTAKRELETLLGTENTARAQELLVQSGAVEGIEARIAELKVQSLTALEGTALRREGVKLLTRLASAMCDRRK